jgi:hypothetical protein
MQKVRIVADGPVGKGTRVFNHDGTEIHGIGSIEILPFRHDDFIVAQIEICAELDMQMDRLNVVVQHKSLSTTIRNWFASRRKYKEWKRSW